VASELVVESNGHDEAEANTLARETTLNVSRFADSVVVGWQYPEPGRQQAKLTLRIPRHLRLQLDGRGTAVVTGIDTVTLSRTSGQIDITATPGAGVVSGEHRGGRLTINGSRAVDLYAVSSETKISNIQEDVRLNIRSGEATLS